MLLIEEPESYLSPGSQEALCDFLIKATVEKQLTLVMTSHSAPIISSLADENLVFIFRQAQGIKVIDGPPPPVLLETIGIEPPIDTIIFVEDEAAKAFARSIFERFRPSFSRRVEISVQNGDGNIIAVLRKVGGQFKATQFVGLFDGDIGAGLPAEVQKFSTVLPGGLPIEVMFRQLVERDPAGLQNATGSADLEAILFGLQGQDHHDWYEGLCRHLGLTKAQLFPMLFQLWMRVEANAEAAKAVVESVEQISSS